MNNTVMLIITTHFVEINFRMRFADGRLGNLQLYFAHPYLASLTESTVLGLRK